MNDTKIAVRAKAQLSNFMGKVFTHFSKPARRFVEECVYGIQASGDTKLSSIVRAIDDDIRPIYTEKRLSRNLDDGTLEPSVARAVLNDGVRFVKDGTLLLFDPTEIRKEYAHAMEHVTLVRDASRSSKEGRDVLVNGYHGCMVAACRIGGRKTVPLALKLWSSRAPGVKGENDEVLKVMKAVYEATGGKGVTVYDRGGDRPAFYDYLIGNGRDFVIRLNNRSVLSWRGVREVRGLARECTMRHSHHVTFDSHGKECNVPISFGAMPVRLPAHPDEELHLVVARGFGTEPMMLITSLPVSGSFRVAVARRRGLPLTLAHRGDHPLRQAGVRPREHPRPVVCGHPQHGLARPRIGLLRHGVDRAACQARGPRGAPEGPRQATQQDP